MSVQISAPATSRNGYRFGSFVLATAVALTVLTVRMADLQLGQVQSVYSVPTTLTSDTVSVPSSRGMIYDDQNRVLADNIPNYVVQIVPHDLPLECPAQSSGSPCTDKATVVMRLADLLQMDPDAIYAAIDSTTSSFFQPVPVATNVNTDVARVIDENHDALPGVQVVSQPRRNYPMGSLFGNILGYTGYLTELSPQDKANGYSIYDTVGKTGVELSYESQLRGTYGKETVALDENGMPIQGLYTPLSNPVPGSSLKLTLDTREQQLAQKALSWGVIGAKVKMGVIIVENPQNGQILAMVSWPGYDDNVMQNITTAGYQALLNNPYRPTENKAVSGLYAPGSTYKLVAATAGLADGIITPSTVIESEPYIIAGAQHQKFYEWNHLGFGPLNIISGLAHSSDTFFYQLSLRVGKDRLAAWAHDYGFGAKTGIDLPNEGTGVVPDDQWKLLNTGQPMYDGDVMYAGIGQGYDQVSPIELLNAYCAMINGGNLWTPHVVSQVIDPSGAVTPVPPKLIRKLPTSPDVLATIRLGTRAVVTSRHTYDLVDLPIKVAGKTGTAEFGTKDRYGRLPYHEWFVGYTLGDPQDGDFTHTTSQLAVVAFVYGADTWGDVATEIVKYYMWLHYGIHGSPFNKYNPGYIYNWITKTTNFYGSTNNH